MDKDKLYTILKDHRRWRETGGNEGARANLEGAYLAGANLADAYLEGASLADAYLADANLAGAYLAGANLARANLEGAYLAGANLARANLEGANLAGANLEGAYLARASLADAYLEGANLEDANLEGASLGTAPLEHYVRGAPIDYAARAARYRARHPETPVVPGLDKAILDIVTIGGGTLDMYTWHKCETTHCRAGWAITLAGDKGRELEAMYGPAVAGGMIYRASTGRSPHFFATNEAAMADIRKCAAREVAP